jgi:hypothetical protein
LQFSKKFHSNWTNCEHWNKHQATQIIHTLKI